MAFFRSHGIKEAFAGLGDWSGGDLGDQLITAELCRVGGLLDISALAYDATMSLLAVGSKTGQLAVSGGPGRNAVWAISPALAIKHLALHAPTGTLIAVDAHDTIQIFDLTAATGPGEPPVRAMAHSARSSIMAIDLSASHSHLFLGYRDGCVECLDLERLCMSPYRIPNLGLEAEELLRRSGVPGAPRRTHVCVTDWLKRLTSQARLHGRQAVSDGARPRPRWVRVDDRAVQPLGAAERRVVRGADPARRARRRQRR